MAQITNVGGADRAVRLILGVVLFVLGFVGVLQGTLAIIGYVVGAIALITGLITYCPVNALLGFNTKKTAPGSQEVNSESGERV